jgi:hypothetical protein
MLARGLVLLLLLGGCGANPLSLLTGGGPNVAANVQAGRTNAQTVGTATISDQRVRAEQVGPVEQSTGGTAVRTERVERVEVQVRNDTPAWIIILLVMGWLLPSPGEIARGVRNLFRRRKTE